MSNGQEVKLNSTRDTLRSAVFSQKPQSQLVKLPDGQEIEVRQTTVGSMLQSLEYPDMQHRMARMLIFSCYVPGTNDRVFEEADFDGLMNLPNGSVYQTLMDAVNGMSLPAQLEAAKKSDEGAPST